MESSPGVVIKTQFIDSSNSFKNAGFDFYIDYIERKDAIEQAKYGFSSYHDYMANEAKTNSLFTKNEDVISQEKKEELKEIFNQAQRNGSVLWQDVISFNNDWLEKNGVYDSKTKTLDHQKIMNATRKAMEVMTTKERLEHTAVWSAAIHYNTDNIHVHIAMVEPTPSPDRIITKGKHRGKHKGKRKQSSIDAMKGKIVHNIMDRSQEYKKINDIIRNRIVKKKHEVSFAEKRQMKKLFNQIMRELPVDKRQWQYNYNSIAHVRPKIDELSEKYILKYHKKNFIQLKEQLREEMELMKEAYGEGEEDKRRYEKFGETKMIDLKTRLGNAILKEMKQVSRQREREQFIRSEIKEGSGKKTRLRHKQKLSILRSLKMMHRRMNHEYESWKNQRHFEQLQQETEQEKLD
ncbi:MobP2 family relaxase [Paenibacillus larvae]|uniref:MobP2 family relaxase n=1 Tax=Paenibacillus larvae TaxID=1464 RepID=UPI00228015F0|nr:MobP2 family relaxase [Paenibacillus larvae]MCY9746949.1 relaxase MobL [Paenibacillus larvae]